MILILFLYRVDFLTCDQDISDDPIRWFNLPITCNIVNVNNIDILINDHNSLEIVILMGLKDVINILNSLRIYFIFL